MRLCQWWHVGGCAVTHLWICDQRKTCGALQALAAVIRGLHAVMPPKACRPGWQRCGRAKERGREDWRGRGGTLWSIGVGQMFDRTGTSQDRGNTGSFIIRGGMQRTGSLLGEVTVFTFKSQKSVGIFARREKVEVSFFCESFHPHKQSKSRKLKTALSHSRL